MRRPCCRTRSCGCLPAGPAAALLLALLLLLPASCGVPGEPAIGDSCGGMVEAEGSPAAEKATCMFYPASPGPGDFTLLAVGPCPEGSDIKLERDPGLVLSPPYRHGDYVYYIVGIDFQLAPGPQTMLLSLEGPGGRREEISGELEIGRRDFKTSHFSVPVKWSGEEADRRIPEERERVRLALETTAPAPLWSQPFIIPLDSRISSEYGAVRIINEAPPRRHLGLDIAADRGTPVAAANDGIVRLAAPLLAQGNMVIIDHGMSLSSSYLHLDSMEVEEGAPVRRGEIIGLVGETGFANGPHLHWEVNLGQTALNPLQLVQGDLFYLPTVAVIH